MLGCARGGWAVSRALGGLYGGRVSCHGSIMLWHANPCAPARQVSLKRVRLFSLGWVVSSPSVGHFGGSVCPSYVW